MNSSLKYLFSTLPHSFFGLVDYYFNPKALKQSDIAPFIDYGGIKKEFINKGLNVVDYKIDKNDFNHWLDEMHFPENYVQGYGTVFTEKALEHYLSSKLLDLNKNDVFVDVAAASSPFYDLVEKKYKCKSFAIDLNLPITDDPRLIQCDATKMPFEDASISKMALHCAYEMLENDDDINFIKEARRVLKPEGKIVIIPLYMAHFYLIMSSPKSNREGINYGKAKRIWRDDNYAVRFARHYSVESFKERIISRKGKLSLKIFYFTNEKDLKKNAEDRIYVKFAVCFTKEK